MCTKCLSENIKGKRPPGRPHHRQIFTVELDHGEIMWECEDEFIWLRIGISIKLF
jgi:hypothetical protein